jgi:hypothetical protein
MANEFETRISEEMIDILFTPGKEIVQSQNFMTSTEQTLSEVRANKTGTAGDENAFFAAR